MKKIKLKLTMLLIMCLVAGGMLFGTNTVSAASDPANAPSDWAFEASSVELNDAIIETYPAIDTNGDGFISVSEANSRTGDITLVGKSITGTLNGIENFTSIRTLNLGNNQITGEIPSNIGNMANLTELRLWTNNLVGEIPSSIGDLSNLKYLSIQANQLSGALPTSIRNLSNLNFFYLAFNNLSGEIPASINDLTNLRGVNLSHNRLTGVIPNVSSLTQLLQLDIGDNSLSGDLPSQIYNLPSLNDLRVNNNINLTGNPSTGFASSTTLNYLDIRGTSLIQASPEIATLGYTVGTFLYDNLAEKLLADNKTTLAHGVTQETIDKAQESANFITNPAIKKQWQDDIDLAQSMLNAKNKVDTLLTTDGANLNEGVDKAQVDEAQAAVNKLPEGNLKDELQAKVDIAYNLLNAKEKTGGLVNPDGSLKIGVDQGKIDEAQKAVDKLPEGATKTELQKIIDDAQKLLNEKNANTVGKVSSNGNNNAEKLTRVPRTGDNNSSAIMTLLVLLVISGGYLITRRKALK